jgi:hypothetical protein
LIRSLGCFQKLGISTTPEHHQEAKMTKGSMIGSAVMLLMSIAPANAGPCTDAINSLSKVLASRDAGSGPTVGAAPSQGAKSQAGSTQQHPPTAIIGKETEGRAASPQDVQRQTAGQPTAAEQPQQPKAGPPQQSASEALNRARMFDQQGNETECMAAVQQAKQLLGSP